jgi:hypothetical protein
MITEQTKIYQDQSIMNSRSLNIVFNFSGHDVLNHGFPEDYKIIDLPMSVNVLADDADLLISKYIVEKCKENGIHDLNFNPILVLTTYNPLIAPLIYIVTQLFGGKLPIIAFSVVEPSKGKREVKYILPSILRKRIRNERPQIQQTGLIIN